MAFLLVVARLASDLLLREEDTAALLGADLLETVTVFFSTGEAMDVAPLPLILNIARFAPASKTNNNNNKNNNYCVSLAPLTCTKLYCALSALPSVEG